MKSKKTIFTFIFCIMAAIRYITASTEVPLELAIKQQLVKDQLQHKEDIDNAEFDQTMQQILKRKRRYLEFPEGSSFQLVYDLIVGVVDYTNYLILGVTVALDWELPSKPPSEIFEDLTERLKDGTLGISRTDTKENIKYIDEKTTPNENKQFDQKDQYSLEPIFKPPMHYRYYYTHPITDSFYQYQKKQPPLRLTSYSKKRKNYWPRNNNFYYTQNQSHPFTKLTQKPAQYSLTGIKYPWWNLSERIRNSFTKRQNIRRFDQHIIHDKQKSSHEMPDRDYKIFPGEHRIYPIFGKRSISHKQISNGTRTSTHSRFKRSGITTAELTKWDRIHIEHHRRTRHDLYQRIETYLNGRGAHGHHCVLRALCETGQKSHEHKPGSFVGEIMRAIFTMPEPLNDGRQKFNQKEKSYDIANTLQGDCVNSYHLCKDSLWSSHFIL